MIKSGFYAHPKFIDVFFYARVVYSDHKRVEAKIEWWNWGQSGRPFKVGIHENKTFTIQKWRELKRLTATGWCEFKRPIVSTKKELNEKSND